MGVLAGLLQNLPERWEDVAWIDDSKGMGDGRPGNDPYAFVEFVDHVAASAALTTLNQRLFLEKSRRLLRPNGWRHEKKDKERRRVTREGLRIENIGATEEGRKDEEEDSLVSWLGRKGVEDEGMQAGGRADVEMEELEKWKSTVGRGGDRRNTYPVSFTLWLQLI
ncbi:hypothetical protein EAG_08121 [Camponotus floridanus]|uniref:RRM domain-containing protein n=1 Tax=Camponotus floridanus TaxID=104421 RepID=E2AEZ1_CAMFO|nr:hypothetical protein EAG_08121 [Camponotus floridanus]